MSHCEAVVFSERRFVLRVAFMWPWFHNLSYNYGRMLDELGVENKCFYVDKHWDPIKLRPGDLAISRVSFRNFPRTMKLVYTELRKFNPDVIFADTSADPRYLIPFFQSKTKIIYCIHDPKPHDSIDEQGIVKKLIHSFQLNRSHATLSFSRSTQEELRASFKLGLLPEIPLEDIPQIQVKERKHYVVFGRIHPYKNTEWLSENWVDITKNIEDEELHIYGHSERQIVGERVKHFNQLFSRADLLKKLSTYRCTILPHVNVSQSGSLLLAFSGSLSAVTSDFSGFREFQPNGSQYFDLFKKRDLAQILEYRVSNNLDNYLGVQARYHLDSLINRSKSDLKLILEKI